MERKTVHQSSGFTHQVVIPVYIPAQEGYFRDSFKNFRLCLRSLCETSHSKTYFTIVNNGSHQEVKDFLDKLLSDGEIHELIHTENIGKANAVIKGLLGHKTELVTIADADVLFLSGWQRETAKIYRAFPKAGVVGIVPQYKMFTYKCTNILIDYMLSKKLRFIQIVNPDAMKSFYKSVGREDANPDWSKLGLALVTNEGTALVGAGHFVATYKRDIFNDVVTFFKFKLGGNSLDYIDGLCLKKDYWRLTTIDNFAYHMGNTHEEWMDAIHFEAQTELEYGFPVSKSINKLSWYIKNDLFYKIFKSRRVRRWYYKIKKLPPEMIFKY